MQNAKLLQIKIISRRKKLMKNDAEIQYLLLKEQLSDVSNILNSHIHSLRKIKRFKQLEKDYQIS